MHTLITLAAAAFLLAGAWVVVLMAGLFTYELYRRVRYGEPWW